MGYFIPGGKIDNSCLRKAKYRLELPDCCCSSRAINAVWSDAGDSSINSRNCSKLLLNLHYLLSGGAVGQIIARPGGWNSGDFLGGIDVHIVSIEMAENTDGTVALLAKAAGAPLGHPAAFQTLNLAPIAVLGKNRLAHIWTGKIVIKDFIYNN